MNLHIFVESDVTTPEDYYASGSRYAFVFDGLGGTGGRKRKNAAGETWPEAKIASRAAAAGLNRLMEQRLDAWTEAMDFSGEAAIEAKISAISEEISRCMHDSLVAAAKEWDATEGKLPTTISGWLTFPMPDGRTLAVALWAGDSRCYMLNAETMRLCSQDDSDEKNRRDAMMDCVIKDSLPMNNRLGVDAKFADCRLNHRCFAVEGPMLLMSCSDGFYNCSESPMHFEYYVRQLGTMESVEEMRREWKSFILSDSRFQDDSATFETIFINDNPDDFEALRAMLTARLVEIEENYIGSYPEDAFEEVEDVDELITKASKSICLNESKYHFYDNLRAFALRCATGEAACPDDMPCVQPIRIMRSEYEWNRKKFDDDRAAIKEKLASAEATLDDRLSRVRRVIYAIEWQKPEKKEKRSRFSRPEDSAQNARSNSNAIRRYMDYIMERRANNWYEVYDEETAEKCIRNRLPFPTSKADAFWLIEKHLVDMCSDIDDFAEYNRLTPRLALVQTGTARLQKRCVSLTMDERARLKTALIEAAVDGRVQPDAVLDEIQLVNTDLLGLFSCAMAYGNAARELDRLDMSRPVEPPSTESLDEFLKKRPYADARYIIEQMVDKGLRIEQLPVTIAGELKVPLDKTAQKLREKKNAKADIIRQREETLKAQLELWEKYRVGFEAFDLPFALNASAPEAGKAQDSESAGDEAEAERERDEGAFPPKEDAIADKAEDAPDAGEAAPEAGGPAGGEASPENAGAEAQGEPAQPKDPGALDAAGEPDRAKAIDDPWARPSPMSVEEPNMNEYE